MICDSFDTWYQGFFDFYDYLNNNHLTYVFVISKIVIRVNLYKDY